VEDETSILKLAKRILTKIGYTVLTADRPKGAIQLVKEYKNQINLIITDVIMPEMYGNELVNTLKSIDPDLEHIKHIFISGYASNAIAQHGVLDEGIAFIRKLFSQLELAKKVRKVLDEK